MEPKLRMTERYSSNNSNKPNYQIEFPKKVSRKRVLSTAWIWFNGNGATRISLFSEALRKSWKSEKDMIQAGGAIYYPYIMMQLS